MDGFNILAMQSRNVAANNPKQAIKQLIYPAKLAHNADYFGEADRCGIGGGKMENNLPRENARNTKRFGNFRRP